MNTNKTKDAALALLQQVQTGAIDFAAVLVHIEGQYEFTPTAFNNGTIRNEAGQNNGACRVFSYAALANLDAQQTIALFAEHYRAVVHHPDGDDHANIRQFMRSGWAKLKMEGQALQARAVQGRLFSCNKP